MAVKGAPKGNSNATKNKPWSEAIRKRAMQRGSLDKIADKLLDMAEDGDIAAIKEFADRLEGKAAQPISNDGDRPFTVELIKEFISR